MTGHLAADEKLREAFQALSGGSRSECTEAQLERVWRAATLELPAADRRALVEEIATDPACAEAWRLAHELLRDSQGDMPVEAERERSWARSWWAAAAVLVLGVGLGVLYQFDRPTVDEFRNAGGVTVESLTPEGAPLPRHDGRLRWTPGPPGSRYRVRVTSEDLRVLTTAEDLAVPELPLSSDVLSTVAPGATVLWQVDVVLPGGETVSSETFVARVQ